MQQITQLSCIYIAFAQLFHMFTLLSTQQLLENSQTHNNTLTSAKVAVESERALETQEFDQDDLFLLPEPPVRTSQSTRRKRLENRESFQSFESDSSSFNSSQTESSYTFERSSTQSNRSTRTKLKESTKKIFEAVQNKKQVFYSMTGKLFSRKNKKQNKKVSNEQMIHMFLTSPNQF
ncbi:hypothetical protein BY458DRAFT_525110 [Sporodiniella umbellata]|nr:hypothetical protein BY458DRAFT_525110 [Sporodiniella umbellata]